MCRGRDADLARPGKSERNQAKRRPRASITLEIEASEYGFRFRDESNSQAASDASRDEIARITRRVAVDTNGAGVDS